MAYPARNPNWAWEWMGFLAPPVEWSMYKPEEFDPRYKKFKQCYDVYFGIGDFDYWKRAELDALSEEDKLELIHVLLENNKKKTSVRKYLGLNEDGTINHSIDPYANSRTEFFARLTLEECRKQPYPHNQRCRYTHGFQCDDCNTFFPRESEEYIRTEEFPNFDISIHNMKAYFYRAKMEIPQEVLDLETRIKEAQKLNCYDIPMEEIMAIRNEVSRLKEKY
jgi:hypothetical protein